jgi:hypothetical protein
MARRRGSPFLRALAGTVAALFLSVSVLSCPAALAADPTAGPVTTEAPTAPPTEAPTTPPTTAPTEPPTIPPTSQLPTNPVEPTEPAEPTEPVEPTAPVTTIMPTITIVPDNTGDSTPVWPWVLAGLGALVLLGGIIWFARSSSRRTGTEAAWRTRRLNAYAEGAALHDAILSASQPAPGQSLSAPADQAQWAEIQRRSNDFTQRLYQLREAAPDQDGQLRTEQVLASLQALRSAMDTERASGPVHGMTADITRERLNDFRVSLYGLRDPDLPGWTYRAGVTSTAVRRSSSMTRS